MATFSPWPPCQSSRFSAPRTAPAPHQSLREGRSPTILSRSNRGQNAGRRLIEAYPNTANWSRENLHARASKLEANPVIAAGMDELRSEAAARAELKGDEVLQILLSIARSKITDYLSWDEGGKVRVIPISSYTPAQRAAVQSIEFDRQTGLLKRLVLQPKVPALALLGKYAGLEKEADKEKELGMLRVFYLDGTHDDDAQKQLLTDSGHPV